MVNPVRRAAHFVADYDEAEFPNATELPRRSLHLPGSAGLSRVVDRVPGVLKELAWGD